MVASQQVRKPNSLKRVRFLNIFTFSKAPKNCAFTRLATKEEVGRGRSAGSRAPPRLGTVRGLTHSSHRRPGQQGVVRK